MITEQGKVHYLLVRGYEEFHDEDEWLGIYSTWENAIAAYEREHAALEREKARKSLANGLCSLPCVKKSRFTALRKRRGDGDTISSQKKICRNEKWNCSMNYFFVPQEALYKQRLLRME